MLTPSGALPGLLGLGGYQAERSAAISGDGETVILGGIGDPNNTGAAWRRAQQ